MRIDSGKTSLVATTTLADGARIVLDGARFGTAHREPTQSRGNDTQNGGEFPVAQRNRITLQTGFWGSHGTTARFYGAGMDVVSEGELRRALAAGVPADRIMFSGVGKTAREMDLGIQAGIYCFNVESEPELEILNARAKAGGS